MSDAEREDKTVELKDTIQGMLSNDFKERLKAELMQLSIRLRKLEIFFIQDNMREEKMPRGMSGLMAEQRNAMREYYDALKKRCKEYGIDTSEADESLALADRLR